MVLFRWKKWLSLRARHELECTGLMGDVFFAFRMLWDNEPLEKAVGRPTGNGKLLSCMCSSRTMGSVYEHTG